MKNLNTNKNMNEYMIDINGAGAFKNGSKNSNFEYFLRNQIAIEAAKYPFLSKVQIKQRILTVIRKEQNTHQKLKKARSEKKSERKTVSDVYDLKESPVKLRSKRSLVPLNVDFISVSKNEVPKRKLTSTGRKHVSFNKEPSIRYRTTSEESSNSTLKLKKSSKKDKDIITFTPTDKRKNHNLSNKGNTSFRMHRYKASQREEIFDQLVKSCSWSYKYPNTSRKFPMEELKAQRTIKARESQNVARRESDSNASDTDSVDENEFSEFIKHDPTESTKLKEAKYLNMTTEDEPENIPRMTSTPYPRKKLNIRNARKVSVERTSSSDNDEVFQTRLSVGNEHILNKEQQIIHYNNPVKHTEQSKERHIRDFKTNNTPIIIQARAYDKNVISTYSDNAKLNTRSELEISNGLKNQKEKFTSGDSLNVEASYTDAELSDSYNQHSLENRVEINCERKEQFHKDRDNNEILNELVNNINTFSEKNSTGVAFQSSKETPEDSIMEDFLNGSFDVSFYKSNSILPKKNIETSMIPNDMYLGKRKCRTSNDTSSKISKKKQLPTTTKRPRAKRATRVKKTTVKTFNPAPEDDELDLKISLKSKNAKGSQQRQKKSSKTLADNKNKTRKSRAKKKNEEDEVSYVILNKNSPLKRPKKYTRNSSLIASRKIKEIENFEKKEEIILDSETDESRILELDNIESDISNYNFQSKKNNYSYTTENAKNNANIYVSEFNYHPNLEDSFKGSLHSFFSKKSKENLCLPKYNTKDVTNKTFFDENTSKNYLKDKNKKIGHKHLNSHQNNLYYPEESQNLAKDTYYSRSRSKSKVTNENSESKQNEIFHSNKNIQSAMRYNGPLTRCKKRTWDSLEKELLGDFDDSCKNNIRVSEVFKKPKLIINPSIKDPDLYISTNARQIIKSATRNGYDAQYGLNTGKNNFELGLTNMTNQYSKASSSPYTKAIVPSCPKSVSIVEKTIAAMNKCTKKFIAPQKNDYQSKNESFFNAESDYLNASPEALFQSNVTVMSSKNKHYYKNEIVGYLKSPGNVRSKSHNKQFPNSDDGKQLKEINVLRRSYVATDRQARKLLNNEMNRTLVPPSGEKCNPWNKLMLELHLNQDNKEDESQRKNLNLKDSKELKCIPPTYNKKFNELPGKNKKRDLKKSNFEAFNGNQYILNDKRNEQENSAKINNQYIDNSKRKEQVISEGINNSKRKEKVISEGINNSKRKEQVISEGINNERLFIDSFELDSLNSDRVIDNIKANTKPVTNKNTMINLENETESKKFSQPVRKTTTEDATKVKRYVKSPTFHLQMEKQGGKLKLVRPSSNSSIITDTSEEIIKSNRNNLRVQKNVQNEHKKESVEKYKKYLRKKMEEHSNLRNDINEDHKTTAVKTKTADEKIAEKKTGIQKVKRTLIAEDEKNYKHFQNGTSKIPTVRNHIATDHVELQPIETKKSEGKVSKNKIVSQKRKNIIDEDVFSVSSDSESYSNQNKDVTGLFHDLFEEP